jgi:Na+-driven multidrug efflux pump
MSVAGRTDAVHTAAYQICLQVWLTSSLLADSLAVAAQSLIARNLAAGDKKAARAVAERSIQVCVRSGC